MLCSETLLICAWTAAAMADEHGGCLAIVEADAAAMEDGHGGCLAIVEADANDDKGTFNEGAETFPFPVATCQGHGWCLRAFNEGNGWQWVWSGAHTYCGMKSQPYAWVKENRASIQKDFSEAGVPLQELQMGSEHKTYKWGTTFSSRALVLVLLSFGKKKR